MRRIVGVSMTVVAAVAAGCVALHAWHDGYTPRNAVAGPAPALPETIAALPDLLDAPPADADPAEITIRNDLPGVVTVLTRAAAEPVIIPWAGGDRTVTLPRGACIVIYNDPWWPYTFHLVRCASSASDAVRLSDLRAGKPPLGWQLCRGRLDDSGQIAWFDLPATDSSG
jgi:hypothetical protein